MKAKDKKKKETYVTYCPACNSTDVDNSSVLIGVGGMPANYVCGNCGHTARIFPELEAPEAQKLLVKKIEDKVDISYGRFTVNLIWKVFGPLAILLAISMFIAYDNAQSLILPFTYLIIGIILSYFAYKKNDIKK